MKSVIEHLRKLGNNETQPRTSFEGICLELSNSCDIESLQDIASKISDKKYKTRLCSIVISVQIVSTLSRSWEKWSGNRGYPIPDTFNQCKATWDIKTTEGKLRRELCLFLADQIELLSDL